MTTSPLSDLMDRDSTDWKATDAKVEALLPVPFPGTGVRYARGIKAGRWVFATGQCGTDYVHGLSPDVVGSGHPLNGAPKAKREAKRLYQNIGEVLDAAGIGFPDVVRVDQYYTSADAVDPYHEVRRKVFDGHVPPSTSNLHQRFARRGQEIEVQAMAAIPGKDFRAQHVSFQPNYEIHASSGYSPALVAGDFRFVPGQTAEAKVHEEGPLDPMARRPFGQWKGTPIKLETDFIIREKLKPSLERAGASLDTVVKAQVYLRDQADVPAFNEVWLDHFKVPPATTIIATADPGFIMPESRIEINTIALDTAGTTRKEVVEGPALFDGWVSAVRAGDLLFLSGLMAVDRSGLANEARADDDHPFFAQPVREEMRLLLKQAEYICRSAGTSLRNVVRAQQFHTDLSQLAPTLDVWSEAVGGQPLPLSAVEVPWLPVPGARLLLDLWVYAPA